MVYESVTIVTITIRPSFQVFCKFQESFQDSFLTENAWQTPVSGPYCGMLLVRSYVTHSFLVPIQHEKKGLNYVFILLDNFLKMLQRLQCCLPNIFGHYKFLCNLGNFCVIYFIIYLIRIQNSPKNVIYFIIYLIRIQNSPKN